MKTLNFCFCFPPLLSSHYAYGYLSFAFSGYAVVIKIWASPQLPGTVSRPQYLLNKTYKYFQNLSRILKKKHRYLDIIFYRRLPQNTLIHTKQANLETNKI